MELSDKVRRVAFIVAAGSAGAGIGYVANEAVEVMGEVKKEALAKEEANREYIERLHQYKPSIRFLPPNSDVDNAIRIYGSGIFGLL